MYALVFFTKHSHLHPHDDDASLITGFTNWIHGWWDNYLDHGQREDLLSTINFSTKG